MPFPAETNTLASVSSSQSLAAGGHAARHNELKAAIESIRDILGGSSQPTGTISVTGNTATDLVRITQTGAGNALVVEDSANPDSTPFVINASGNVGIGTTNPGANLDIAANGSTVIQQTRSSDNTAQPNLQHRKSRGTNASPIVVQSNDIVAGWIGQGYDGSAYQNAASISMIVNGTPGAGDMPGAILFSTVPDGSTTLTERMRIDNAGNVGIGTSSPGYMLTVNTTSTSVDNTMASLVSAAAVSGTSTTTLRIEKGTNYGGVIQGYIAQGVGSGLIFGTLNGSASPTERMRIDNAGLITGTGTSLGAWTSYTPTLGGTGWALGNGTAAGRYCQIGKLVAFRLTITFGSTSTFSSTDDLTLTLPVTSFTSAIPLPGIGRISDVSLGNSYVVAPYLASATTVTAYYPGTSGLYTAIRATAPFTWANTDVINLSGVYQSD